MSAHIQATDSKLSIARDRLNQILAEGTRNAGSVIEHVLSTIPDDRLVRGDALHFAVMPRGHLCFSVGGEVFDMHRHAISQLLSRVDIPAGYAESLAVPDKTECYPDNQWRRDLLAHILSEHYQHTGGRFLVRSLNGQVRGFLSDHFKRLDSRPLLDSFVGACQEIGAVPFEGVASDLRSSVRAIVPTIVEPVPGEAMVFGLSWTNSDFGAGTYGISAFMLRLVCLNGAVGESQLKQVHLGGRIPDDIELSQNTHDLHTRATISATRDVVRAVLSPAAIAKQSDLVRHAHQSEADFSAAFRKLRSFTKAEQDAVRDAFEGPDMINLPPGKTYWRFSNALSWVANATTDPERKLELQRAAGAVLT